MPMENAPVSWSNSSKCNLVFLWKAIRLRHVFYFGTIWRIESAHALYQRQVSLLFYFIHSLVTVSVSFIRCFGGSFPRIKESKLHGNSDSPRFSLVSRGVFHDCSSGNKSIPGNSSGAYIKLFEREIFICKVTSLHVLTSQKAEASYWGECVFLCCVLVWQSLRKFHV